MITQIINCLTRTQTPGFPGDGAVGKVAAGNWRLASQRRDASEKRGGGVPYFGGFRKWGGTLLFGGASYEDPSPGLWPLRELFGAPCPGHGSTWHHFVSLCMYTTFLLMQVFSGLPPGFCWNSMEFTNNRGFCRDSRRGGGSGCCCCCCFVALGLVLILVLGLVFLLLS